MGLFSIPLSEPFLERFAQGVLAEVRDQPSILKSYTIFLPTRRAIRTLKKLFLDLYDGPSLFLPKMIPLGDVSEDELSLGNYIPNQKEIPPLQRQALIAQLISAFGKGGLQISPAQAFKLSQDLMGLMDQIILEDLECEDLKELVGDHYAEHWQMTLNFLELVTQNFPKILEEKGYVGPAESRRARILSLIEGWKKSPPKDPIVLAGSTGSMKLTQELMEAVVSLPKGRVILPGFREQDYEMALNKPTHPQHTLANTVHYLKGGPRQMKTWHKSTPNMHSNLEIVAQAFQPELKPLSADKKLKNVQQIDCAHESEEASVIALLLREVLETPDKTGLLITPDRTLARRVAAHLKRWDLQVDDSSGYPLSETPVGILFRLLGRVLVHPNDLLSLLALLKHPLLKSRFSGKDLALDVQILERTHLRGHYYGDRLLETLLNRQLPSTIRTILQSIKNRASTSFKFPTFFAQHVKLFQDFIEGETSNLQMEKIPGGKELTQFITNVHSFHQDFPDLTADDYESVLMTLLTAVPVRDGRQSHPRLSILGPLEGRLMQADRVILAGLNEGVWPQQVDTGPWLSRPMRVEFGLQPLEQRIGLATHDFLRAFSTWEVFLTRATKSNGSPTIPSRWLMRLQAILPERNWQEEGAKYLAWASKLDKSSKSFTLLPPSPKPAIEKRPRQLSVTQVETWMRDPYAIYARHILKLKKLDPLVQDPSAADWGNLVHACLEAYKKGEERGLEPLLSYASAAFDGLDVSPIVKKFWKPRFLEIANWFIEQEAQLLPHEALLEKEGSYTCGDFTLTAKADRIDLFPEGKAVIIDYKTGSVPSENHVKYGYACQLPLEGLIFAEGGFSNPLKISPELQFWSLTGKTPAGEIKALKEPDALIKSAREGLKTLIQAFQDPATPYYCQPRPEWKPDYSDYDHFARVQEWGQS